MQCQLESRSCDVAICMSRHIRAMVVPVIDSALNSLVILYSRALAQDRRRADWLQRCYVRFGADCDVKREVCAMPHCNRTRSGRRRPYRRPLATYAIRAWLCRASADFAQVASNLFLCLPILDLSNNPWH